MYRWLVLCLAFLASCQLDAETVLIENATIVDGTGADRRNGDVRFSRDGIIAVGDLERLDDEQIVDASGLIIAPGFIDSHNHLDENIPAIPHARSAVSQGITTVVFGNDGLSSAPLAQFRESLKETPPAVNFAAYTGHGFLRSAVMKGDFRREATNDEVAAMQALLINDMQQGSLGLVDWP